MTLVAQTNPAGAPPVRWLAGRGRLAQSILLEERPPNSLIMIAIGVLVAGIAAFIVWASLTTVTEIAPAPGEITPIGSVKRIQHLEGGIVSEVLVRDGDIVEQGQPLVRLQSEGVLPELQQLRVRLGALKLRENQLLAFQNQQTLDPANTPQPAGGIAEAQGDLLRTKLAALKSQQVVLTEQLTQKQSEQKSLMAQRTEVQQQLAITDEQVRVRSGLVEKGLASRMLLLDLQRDHAQVRAQLASLDGQILANNGAIAEATARLSELDDRTRRDTAEEIAKVRAESDELREQVLRSADRVNRLTITSPVKGTVKGLQTQTVGGVIPAGGTVMDIIPFDAPLIVEARVQTKDIGFVEVGQPVRVKVATYDYTRFGAIEGQIETISATTFEDEKNPPYYKARIKLDKSFVGTNPDRNRVIPGMTVMADIRTGEKTVLAYLLKPIVRAGDEALTER